MASSSSSYLLCESPENQKGWHSPGFAASPVHRCQWKKGHLSLFSSHQKSCHPRAASYRSRSRFVRQATYRHKAVCSLRVGHGYDLHRLEAGLPLILGGVHLQHEFGCAGHSDGDAVYHCIVDAVLGALALPDIGQMFPDSDPRYKGKESSFFMKGARHEMEERGWSIANLDVTIILERPKLSPVKESIRSNVARELGVHPADVNIKAKTHEKVDSVGEGRAVEVHAVVLLMQSEKDEESMEEVLEKETTQPNVLARRVLSLAETRVKSIHGVTSQALQNSDRTHAMDRLAEIIRQRKNSDPSFSWTAKLLSKGRSKIAQKIGEEATEVVIDAISDNRNGVIKESADLLYHLSVLWADMEINAQDIWSELASREGSSGIAEKASRQRR